MFCLFCDSTKAQKVQKFVASKGETPGRITLSWLPLANYPESDIKYEIQRAGPFTKIPPKVKFDSIKVVDNTIWGDPVEKYFPYKYLYCIKVRYKGELKEEYAQDSGWIKKKRVPADDNTTKDRLSFINKFPSLNKGEMLRISYKLANKADADSAVIQFFLADKNQSTTKLKFLTQIAALESGSPVLTFGKDITNGNYQIVAILYKNEAMIAQDTCTLTIKR